MGFLLEWKETEGFSKFELSWVLSLLNVSGEMMVHGGAGTDDSS
jgi:hypothetical protein